MEAEVKADENITFLHAYTCGPGALINYSDWLFILKGFIAIRVTSDGFFHFTWLTFSSAVSMKGNDHSG